MKRLCPLSCGAATALTSSFFPSCHCYHTGDIEQQLKPKSKLSSTKPPRKAVLYEKDDVPFTQEKGMLVGVGCASPAPSGTPQTERHATAALPSRAPFDTYVATLEKPLVPRHAKPLSSSSAAQPSLLTVTDPSAVAEERELEELTRKDGYDPATVVRINKRSKQIHLNSIQKELVWAARRREYQAMLERVVACLQSHRSPIEQCFTLLALHDEIIQRRLRLRTDTYEGIFHTFYAVAVQSKGGTGHTPASAQASLTEGYALFEDELVDNPSGASGSVPEELASVSAAAHALLTPHFIENLWQMYRYMVDSGTDPSARIVQYVMGVLEHAVARATSSATSATASTTLLEAKAHSLIMDLDRFQLPPTEYTLNSYIGVCDGCGVMHLAVARVADFQSRHERQASAGTYARLITGLVRHDQCKEAMSIVSTMQSVPMTSYLLNAVLQAARFSPDPLSAFTFYRAAVRTQGSTGLQPTQVTFSILLEVVCQGLCAGEGKNERGDQAQCRKTMKVNLDFLLREMRRHRVKGNGLFLNKLLGVFESCGQSREAAALRASMEAKRVRIFDELRVR